MDQAQGLRNVVKLQSQINIPEARVLTITSGKGGVGKSNTAVNLAVAFRNLGKRVIIFDADLGLANVEVMFAVPPRHNLSDVIYGSMDIEEVITTGPMDIGFISGGRDASNACGEPEHRSFPALNSRMSSEIASKSLTMCVARSTMRSCARL